MRQSKSYALDIDEWRNIVIDNIKSGDIISYVPVGGAELSTYDMRLVLQILIEDDGSYSYMMLNVLGDPKIWKLKTCHKTNMLKGFAKIA
jgi:hypothetical protein